MKVSNLVGLLNIALERSDERIKAIRDFQDLVNKSEGVIESEAMDAILRELAYDLEFYVPIDLHRKQVPAYFGDRKAKSLIRKTLKLLKEEGVDRAAIP